MTPHAHPSRAVVSLVVAAILVGGCGAAGTPTPIATGTPTPSTTTTPAPTAQPTSTPTVTPEPSPSPEPTAPSTLAPTAAPSTAGPTGFACAYPTDRAASRTDLASLTDVRAAAHPDYDRVVFEFAGQGVPVLELERARPPFLKDPSGLPLVVPGTSFVRIVMRYASGGGYAQPDGVPTYTGPSAFRVNGTRLTSLVAQGDFEGVLSWIAGLTGPMCYQISTLAGPSRLVIDFRAP